MSCMPRRRLRIGSVKNHGKMKESSGDASTGNNDKVRDGTGNCDEGEGFSPFD